MYRYIDIVENTYRKDIFEKIENEEFGTLSLFLDIGAMSEDTINNSIRIIDKYPKYMGQNSPYSFIESLVDNCNSKLNSFIRVILLLLSYSDEVIIDGNINDKRKRISNLFDFDSLKDLNNIDTFSLKDIEYDYKVIIDLARLALEDKLLVSFYLIDLKLVLDISENSILVYNEGFDFDVIEKIANIEGLYLREY